MSTHAQHERHLQVRTPRVRLPHGAVRQIEPDFAGRLGIEYDRDHAVEPRPK